GQYAQRRCGAHTEECKRFLVDTHRQRLGGAVGTAARRDVDDVELAQRPERVENRTERGRRADAGPGDEAEALPRARAVDARRPGNTRLSSNAHDSPIANAGAIVPTR